MWEEAAVLMEWETNTIATIKSSTTFLKSVDLSVLKGTHSEELSLAIITTAIACMMMDFCLILPLDNLPLHILGRVKLLLQMGVQMHNATDI